MQIDVNPYDMNPYCAMSIDSGKWIIGTPLIAENESRNSYMISAIIDHTDPENGNPLHFSYAQIDPNTLRRNTGYSCYKNDCSGYFCEGDIVLYNRKKISQNRNIFEIKKKFGSNGFCLRSIYGEIIEEFDANVAIRCIILGNIYENDIRDFIERND